MAEASSRQSSGGTTAALEEERAEHRAEHRAEAADDRGGEHDEVLLGREEAERELPVDCTSTTPATDGEEAGDRERGELGADRGDAVGVRAALVLAQRDEHPAGAAAADADDRDDAQHEHDQAEVVHAFGRRAVVPHAEDRLRFERLGRHPVEELRVEEVGDGRERERERRHREVEAAQPQRGQADDDRDERAGDARRAGSTSARSRPQSVVALAPSAPPIATKPIWPSDTCPAQPVRIVIERLTIAKISTAAALSVLPGRPIHGRYGSATSSTRRRAAKPTDARHAAPR